MNLRTVAGLAVLAVAIVGPSSASAATGSSAPRRVAVVPLDDRPVNLSDVVAIGSLAGAEVASPPRHRLGRGDVEGDADGIAEWLDGLDVSTIDAVIVSTDMLAYGGVPASRRPDTTIEKSLNRLKALERLKARRKDLHVYAFATLLGLSLGDDGHKGAWKTGLARWAELGGSDAAEPGAAAEAKSIEGQIPTTMLDRYKGLRARNLAVARAAVNLLAAGGLDYLAFVTDGLEPRGLAASERSTLTAALAPALASHRTAITTDGDRLATLLLTRALAVPERRITVGLVPATLEPSEKTVLAESLQIAGLTEASATERSQAMCVIYSGRDDGNAAATAAEKATRASANGNKVSIADLGSSPGDGAAIPLVEALRARHAFQRLAGFAAGDPSITIARALAAAAIARDDSASRAAREQVLLHRLAVDFVYASVVRPQAIEDFLEPRHIDPAHLDADQTQRTETYLIEQVKPLVENLIGDVSATRKLKPGPNAVRDVNDFKLKLTWRRLDEVEISFALTPG
jgi:hypothetical protein